MADIATEAGVSTMTVSRALKPDSSISDATRARILAIADRLGYVMDTTATGFANRRTGFVAVTIPSVNNSNFADSLRGISEGLRSTGHEVLLGYTDYDKENEELLVEQLLRRRPEAIVVTGSAHTARCRRLIESAAIPVVEIWDLPTEPLGDVVGFSNAMAGRIMLEHFVGQGYQKPAFIGGATERDTRGLDRRRGFEQALLKHGLDPSGLLAFGMPPVTMRQGADAMDALLDDRPETDCVMCVSDLAAFGALNTCLRRGLRVPQDIGLAGFGAYDVAELSIPAMTTIDVQAYEIGRITADILKSRFDGQAPERLCHKIEPKLIARASTISS